MSSTMIRHAASLAAASAVAIGLLAAPAPARAQDVMSKESVAELKTAFLADIEAMRVKFVGLAEAFPQDKYDWRPMDGVRSVAEVLMLAAMEGYSFIPNTFGGKPADLGSKEEMTKLRALNTKAMTLMDAHPHEGHALYREALTVALAHDLVWDALRAYNNLAISLDLLDRAEDLVPLLEEARELARRRGDGEGRRSAAQLRHGAHGRPRPTAPPPAARTAGVCELRAKQAALTDVHVHAADIDAEEAQRERHSGL